MLRVALFNEEERVVRAALEEFIARRHHFTGTNPSDAHHVHDRGVAREVLHTMRATVPERDPFPSNTNERPTP